jgi:hypothetical protein
MVLHDSCRDALRAGLGALFACCLFVYGAAAAGGCDSPTPVRFPIGASQTQITGGIARGEMACWTIGGRRGQRMIVRQADAKRSNIVLQIYRSPWSVAHSADGLTIHGQALPGAAEGEDTKSWTGVLPETGSYLLVLGTSWGGGPYRVHIRIR